MIGTMAISRIPDFLNDSDNNNFAHPGFLDDLDRISGDDLFVSMDGAQSIVVPN